MSKKTQYKRIIEIMQNRPHHTWKSREVGAIYYHLYGQTIQYGTRIGDLARAGYVLPITYDKQSHPDKKGTYYLLRGKGLDEGVTPIILPNHRGDYRIKKTMEESETKALNKEINTTLLECPPPPVRISLFGKIKHFVKNLIDTK